MSPAVRLAFSLLITGWPLSTVATENASATEVANVFFDRAFDERVARSPQEMTRLGLKTDYDRWDDLSEEHAAGDVALWKRQLAELKRTIQYDALDDQAKMSYRLFERETTEAIDGWRWRFHDYSVNQMGGPHTDAPALLINLHGVATVADAQAYIARLRGFRLLFGQLAANLERQRKRGISPPRFVFPLLIASCREVITGEPFDQSGRPCALLEDFSKKATALADVEASIKAQLIADARVALIESVMPAYRDLITLLEAHGKLATDEDGVWKLPDGGDYYAYVLRRAITTSASPEEVHQLGLREVARIHADMGAIIKRLGFQAPAGADAAQTLQAFFRYLREDPRFYYPTTEAGKAAYMARATEIIDAMRARLDEFFITKPKAPLVIKPVEPFREPGAARASYEEPSPDGVRPGVYFINTVDMQGLPIFEMETLAHHEAIPGHHMQVAIAQELTGLPKFRRHGYNTAYVEGWALYAEYFPKEFGFYADPYMDFGRLYDELLRAVRLVVDTGLHTKRWTRQQVIDYFRQNTPTPGSDIITETNRYIVWPGQATAYKIGQLKILELRELARRELGPAFELRAYHDLILRNGALPMDLLEENVRAWIARGGRL